MTDTRATKALAQAAVAVSVLLLAAKLAVAWWTGSTAVLSDGLEGVVNVITSLVAAWAVGLSSQPRDKEHPYGHGKAEYISVALEGGLLLAAALGVCIVSLWRLLTPIELETVDTGAIAMALIAIAGWIGGGWIERGGRKLSSPSLIASGEHFKADAVTSFGVFVALGLVHLSGWGWLDPAIASALGGWMLYKGASIIREALAGILDEANPEVLDRIAKRLTQMRKPGWLSPHHTKVHRLGQHLHIDLHIVFPLFWSLQQTHDDTKIIERGLREEFGEGTEVMIHMEPCTPAACDACDVKDCPIRSAPFYKRREWTAELISPPRRPPSWAEQMWSGSDAEESLNNPSPAQVGAQPGTAAGELSQQEREPE